MYHFLKPILFRVDPERAHHLTMTGFRADGVSSAPSRAATAGWRVDDPRLARTVFGLRFSNPVGLAAGFDKDGVYYPLMARLGFGSVELGTVTPRPQEGNAKPRLFRLPVDRALVNRMGFNNAGVDALARNLERQARPAKLIIGGNIGKNKDTPNEDATSDYLTCLRRLGDLVDYFAVNVSSPNTPGLRALQAREPLTRLLHELQSANQGLSTPRPMLLKIAPDLDDAELTDIVELAVETGLAGVIATNTTTARAPLTASAKTIEAIGAGGLSGAPVFARSTEVLRKLRAQLPEGIEVVGVGGVVDAETAMAKFEAGAALVQLYSGMVYAGPTLPSEINRAVLRTL